MYTEIGQIKTFPIIRDRRISKVKSEVVHWILLVTITTMPTIVILALIYNHFYPPNLIHINHQELQYNLAFKK